MAEIEKGLPNTRTKIDIPSEEEMAEEVSVQEQQEEQKGPVEVLPEEDGVELSTYRKTSVMRNSNSASETCNGCSPGMLN